MDRIGSQTQVGMTGRPQGRRAGPTRRSSVAAPIVELVTGQTAGMGRNPIQAGSALLQRILQPMKSGAGGGYPGMGAPPSGGGAYRNLGPMPAGIGGGGPHRNGSAGG